MFDAISWVQGRGAGGREEQITKSSKNAVSHRVSCAALAGVCLPFCVVSVEVSAAAAKRQF
jgi:hypothetical protein